MAPDTDLTPDAGSSGASRATFLSGNATRRAAAAIGESLLQTASRVTGRPLDELTLRDGYVQAGVEGCDDGNLDNSDGCLDATATGGNCQPAGCGDGFLWVGVEYCDDEYQAARGADALVLATEWHQFRGLDLGRLKDAMTQPVVVDLRNVYDPEPMRANGFVYVGVGR